MPTIIGTRIVEQGFDAIIWHVYFENDESITEVIKKVDDQLSITDYHYAIVAIHDCCSNHHRNHVHDKIQQHWTERKSCQLQATEINELLYSIGIKQEELTDLDYQLRSPDPKIIKERHQHIRQVITAMNNCIQWYAEKLNMLDD